MFQECKIIQFQNFLKKYPNADMSKFDIIELDGKININFGHMVIFGDSPEDFNNFSEPNKSKLMKALGVTDQVASHKLF